MQSGEETRQNVEGGIETEGLTNNPLTHNDLSERIDPITVLEASPTGRIYSYGTENGLVHLFDLHQDRLFKTLTSQDSLSIEQISWSYDGKYLCFSDTDRMVFIISVTTDDRSPELVVVTKAEVSVRNITKGPITQLLFRPDLSCLLVSTSNTVHTISLISFSIVHSAELRIAECKWIVHPQNPELIIGFGPEHTQVLGWDLIEKQFYITWLAGSSEQLKVDQVIATQDKRHILVQKSHRDNNVTEKGHHYFETSKLSTPSPLRVPAVLPQDISSEIVLPLSFQSDNRLIFLSRNFSICSWKIPSDSGRFIVASRPRPNNNIDTPTSSASSVTPEKEFEELFSLPWDSTSRDNLSLCAVWGKEKSFLYPRNGEVVVVRCEVLG
ncbi:uncharacterized protein GGS22DRAFT_168043 [Annulohypoxylon maeteangense]|uniref:uncharacterized protein n=1 Tax=Annulohypoxylon maeteangense TaxID=1927788 RepID=UPI002007FFBB|nr:uncharacterized protein GGS22DRAFT_168043 [Annulohypoxylon maeteangense]KAI0883174.1 hypothetical protein GGS22DRAFT_168043 [Annulohypoxylon maeteangense]